MGPAGTRETPRPKEAPLPALPLSRVIYRSRTTQSYHLGGFLAAPQQHQGAEKLSGTVVYDRNRFFQCLEVPRPTMSRVTYAIGNDNRHAQTGAVHAANTLNRQFAGWSMQLLVSGAKTAPHPAAAEPPAIAAELYRPAADVPALPVRLVSVSASLLEPPASPAPSATLRGVFLDAVVPQLYQARQLHSPAPSAWANAERATESRRARCTALAETLMEPQQDALPIWLEALQEDGSSVADLATCLFEPVARRLGDLWADDGCSEFDVTFALCRLQNLARLLAAPTAHQRAGAAGPVPSILIAPEPGELHRLGAALDRIVMEAAGWAPVYATPEDQNDLRDLLAEHWFDVLDLSLSAAFRREHDLPRVAETIADARRASRNPALKVIVGGRVFAEERLAGRDVGADAVHHTAGLATRAVSRLLGQKEGFFFF